MVATVVPLTVSRSDGDDGRLWEGWHLTVMSQGVVLFTASTRSRQEIEALAAEARRLRSDVKISIRYRGPRPRSDPRQLELDLPEPPL